MDMKRVRLSRKALESVTRFVTDRALIHSEGRGSGFSPIKLLGMREAFGTKLFAKRGVRGNASQFEFPAFKVFRIELDRGVTDDFAEGATIGTDHGAAAGHGFQWRQAEAFVEGWINASASS